MSLVGVQACCNLCGRNTDPKFDTNEAVYYVI